MNELEREYFQKIVEYCKKIQRDVFAMNNSFDSFMQNEMCQQSISFSLLQIGELVTVLKKRSPKLIKSLPQIPWHEIVGMRNQIAHGYGSISMKRTWETAIKDIPELAKFCQQLLDEQKPNVA